MAWSIIADEMEQFFILKHLHCILDLLHIEK